MIRPLLLSLALATTAQADPCEAPLPPAGTVFSGDVRYVGDGDGLCTGNSPDPATWVEVRVSDFYAPELHEPGGREAKATLSRIVMGKRLVCVAGRRSYDRTIARCSLEGRSVGDLMKAAGVAEGGRR